MFRIEQLRVVAVHPDWYSGGVRVMMGMMMVVMIAGTAGIDRGRRRRQRWEVRMVSRSCRRRCRCRVVMHRDRIGGTAGAATATTATNRGRYCRGHGRRPGTASDSALTDATRCRTRARRGGIREGVQKGIVSFFNFDGFRGALPGSEINRALFFFFTLIITIYTFFWRGRVVVEYRHL